MSLLVTPADFIRAVNMSNDLGDLAVSFLKLWREHANGVNGVTISDGPFKVGFLPTKEETELRVVVFHTRKDYHSEPVFYEPDDYEFTEGYGGNNLMCCTSVYNSHPLEDHIRIPISLLTSSSIEKDLKFLKLQDAEKKEQAFRQAEIADLESRLAKLKRF